jgi:hypothetical protein
MSNAFVGSAVWHNYVFSKLGRSITKAQIAYFTSEPSRPLAEGMNKSGTNSLLEFFEKTKEISYHTLWDMPLNSGGTALTLSVNTVCEKCLVPNPQVIQQSNVLRTTITKEGLTQESYIVGTLLRTTTITKEGLTQESHEDEEEENLFASSLLVKDLSSIAMVWAQDIPKPKPQINEVLQCLDTLKSQSRIKQARKLLNASRNELRLELGRSSRPKWNIENCLRVNLKVEENLSKKSRSYASKNC